MDRADIFKGAVFTCNVNGAKLEIVKIEGDSVVFKDLRTDKKFTYGTQAFERCDIEGGEHRR